ncbi:hypothetical protein XENOCAPTIV_008394 [Xenoophorus captivus]|uniref:Zinc finger protein 512 C2HC zinc finger domain-containing protein n=1 Tax=Xenoophorus captivus TaxID=1517983 RepID=A0ABV0Q8R8_9TELE
MNGCIIWALLYVYSRQFFVNVCKIPSPHMFVQPTVAEKLSHGCPYCEAAFATKVRLEKHKLPMENSPPSPVFIKVKKTYEVSTPSQNGELAHLKSERKVHNQVPASQQIHPSHTVQPQPRSQSTSSDAGGSESEGGSLPSSYPDEDPERMRHSMTKVEEKLKAGRVKRPEGCGFSDEPQRRPLSAQSSKKEPATPSSGGVSDIQWQRTISERGEVVCPTCSIVTRKTIHGLKKHMEICQKVSMQYTCLLHIEPRKIIQIHAISESRRDLCPALFSLSVIYNSFQCPARLSPPLAALPSAVLPSGSEGQTGSEHEERERLRRVLKQMGRIKCPSEVFSSLFL